MIDEPYDDLVGDLALGGPPLAQRRRVLAEYVRDLSEADIAALSVNRGIRAPALVRIHSSHHALARCLATGMKRNQVALVTGYSPHRITQLEADPAFQALVADYRTESKSIVADMTERMSNISLDAIELLQERLHEAPGEFSVPLLLDVVKAFADRTGHGPGQEVNVKVTQDYVDRPPRETYEEWKTRRNHEIQHTIEHEESEVPLIDRLVH